MTPLKGLQNLGPTIIKKLNEIGVHTKEDLKKKGSVGAYKQICRNYSGQTIPVCYYLYSLEGALRGVHWDQLPKRIKTQLLRRVGK